MRVSKLELVICQTKNTPKATAAAMNMKLEYLESKTTAISPVHVVEGRRWLFSQF